jgi:hypothetical protein
MVMVVAPSVMVVMSPVVMMSPAAMMMVMVTAMAVLRLSLAHIQSAQPQSEHGGER